jgi:hypothetical protein
MRELFGDQMSLSIIVSGIVLISIWLVDSKKVIF